MLLEIEQQEFNSLGSTELFIRCTEPTLVQMRVSDPSEKIQIMTELNRSQQAMFMFRLLYPAQNSAVDYYSWLSYLIEQPGYWSGVISGLRFFSEYSLIQLLEESETILEAHDKGIQPEHNTELQASLHPLFARFQSLLPESIERISGYIRSNPEEFVQLIN
ncbi:hypothetical protein [Paenibacillus sp. RC67]|uniref:hypothetical protein n=1 Tax=Paenibacillus sp. RC67 TaxID=3039392 RepID=UPI0024AE409F|nr:hypothetical protein [Paenibacillus sp. RC67]